MTDIPWSKIVSRENNPPTPTQSCKKKINQICYFKWHKVLDLQHCNNPSELLLPIWQKFELSLFYSELIQTTAVAGGDTAKHGHTGVHNAPLLQKPTLPCLLLWAVASLDRGWESQLCWDHGLGGILGPGGVDILFYKAVNVSHASSHPWYISSGYPRLVHKKWPLPSHPKAGSHAGLWEEHVPMWQLVFCTFLSMIFHGC